MRELLKFGFALVGIVASPPCFADGPSFRNEVRPILSEKCFSCHGFDEKSRESGLRLDLLEGATAAADSGKPAIVPGKPQDSELLRRITTGSEDEKMPPAHSGKTLTEKQIEILRKWISQGAPYEKHWSFEAPISQDPPAIASANHPIDRFIQRRLADNKLTASPIAEPTILLRRAYLDLIGLPPSVADTDAFLTDYARNPEQAFHGVVDKLLKSSHYGERWGRWWLDQARYADSNGYSIDAPREIWKFRDWVVEALNSDMPFDQFTIEQLAGDLLPNATQSQKVATGFHRNTQINQEGGIDPEQFRIDSVFDRVATTGSVWLGLTIGCCQCHNHKFDPITQKEYYQIFAYFNNQDEPTMKVVSNGADSQEIKVRRETAERELDSHIQKRMEAYHAWESKLTAEEKSKMTSGFRRALDMPPEKRSRIQVRELFNIEVGKIDADYQALLQTYNELNNRVNGEASTLVMQERKEPRKTTVFIKGDFTRPAEEVSCGTPEILHPLENASSSTTRLDFARWLTSSKNPLTARVIVNRVWQQYFGKGIVETENDFGTLGSAPTHPELLDWLAIEFQKTWSLKSLHRLIMTSHTYRQSSMERQELSSVDPNNYLLGRQNRLRLDAEIIRDIGLAASGLLNPNLGGPPVFPPIPEGVMTLGQVKRSWKTSSGQDRYRRALYTFVYRATPPPSLTAFDAPDGYSSCTRRLRSNTPLQALTLLNDSAFFEFAQALNARIEKEGLESAFQRCVSRKPSKDEIKVLGSLDSLSAARVMLNMDETMTRE